MVDSFENSDYFKFVAERGDTGHQGGKAATDLLLAQASLDSSTKLLEIGCGSGKTFLALNEMDLGQLVAIDISRQALAWLSERNTKPNPSAYLNRADVHHLPFPDASFDVVLIESVLIFCEIETALKEIYRVMKPNAVLLLNETLALNPAIIPHVPKLREVAKLPILSPYTQADWESIFSQAGFEIRWQSTHPLNRLKFLMLLQLMEITDMFNGEDYIGFGLWSLHKSAIK